MRLGTWLMLGACTHCAPLASPLAHAPAAAVPVIRAEPQQATPPAPARTAGPNRCLPKGPPVLPAARKTQEPSTCVDHRRREAALARSLVKEFQPTIKGGTVEVHFGCDPLTSDVREIHLETGYGHGGYFSLWRLTREDDQSTEFRVLGFEHRLTGGGYDRYTYEVAARFDAKVLRGTVGAKAVLGALQTARPAMTAAIRELEPPPSATFAFGRSSFFSSGNFHHKVEILDDMPNLLSGRYTGYPNGGEQGSYLGLSKAMGVLIPLVEKGEADDAPASEAERAYFAERFLAAEANFDDEYAWWVRNRYVRLSGRLGDPVLVPALVRELGKRVAEARKSTEPDAADRLVDVLTALAGVTHWDARFESDGTPRPLLQVADEYLDECQTALHAGR
ncbi:MAG TPA: hypothetical protein PKA88_10655 [Polyangiaceae bacterium]|nr:hypothetical protein [Polyangiaceae bacterium]